ncbi:MAG: HEAT repeat domain-containing protein, partial [Planctomycetota bacterium]
MRTTQSIDDRTWEYWWALNQSDYLPVLGYEDGSAADEGYADGRDRAREGALDLLLEALRDPDDQVRTAAARALAVAIPSYRRGDQEVALARALDDSYREVREIAGLALARRQVTSIAPRLRDVLESPSEHRVTRAFAAMALIELEDAEGIELAMKVSEDATDPDLAGAILIALGATKDTRYTQHLLRSLRRRGGSATRRRRVHCDAMMALGKLGDPVAVKQLVRKLGDRERLIQRAAA